MKMIYEERESFSCETVSHPLFFFFFLDSYRRNIQRVEIPLEGNKTKQTNHTTYMVCLLNVASLEEQRLGEIQRLVRDGSLASKIIPEKMR